MITLSLVICLVATGMCYNFSMDRGFQSRGECEATAKEFTTSRVDEMRALGYEFHGPNCRWLGGGLRG